MDAIRSPKNTDYQEEEKNERQQDAKYKPDSEFHGWNKSQEPADLFRKKSSIRKEVPVEGLEASQTKIPRNSKRVSFLFTSAILKSRLLEKRGVSRNLWGFVWGFKTVLESSGQHFSSSPLATGDGNPPRSPLTGGSQVRHGPSARLDGAADPADAKGTDKKDADEGIRGGRDAICGCAPQ
jgi:hypothetical protein